MIDKNIDADIEAIKKIRDGDFSISTDDLFHQDWIIRFDQDDGPTSYYSYDHNTKKAEFLFYDRSKLESYKLSKMEPISFTARDGMTIYGYLTLPVGLEPKNLPTVLFVHGGPWGRDTWGFQPWVQFLANRGFAVLQVNYRGSTGYGKQFINAGDREWGGKMHTDLLDGKQWAVDKGYCDPTHICIFGGSYGGYASLVGAAFTPDQFCCAIDLVGPSNLVSLLKTIPPYWEVKKEMFTKRLGSVDKDEEFLKSRSPLFKANQIKIPMLIAQGANDPRVKQAESDQIVAAIRKNGKPVQYLVFPDEGHGFKRPEKNLIFFGQVESFLSRYLGGRMEPIADIDKADGFLQ